MDGNSRRWRAGLDATYAVIEDVLDGRRPALVYPAARLGRAVAQGLASRGVQITAFGDGDPHLDGTRLDGLPILSPAAIADQHAGDPILLASAMYDSAIREDLEARGCRDVIPFGYLNLRLPELFSVREYDGAWDAALDPRNRRDIEAAHGLLADAASRLVFEGKLAYYVDRDKRHLDDIRSSQPIYLDPTVWQPSTDEIVVDGGAFVGDTLAAFRGSSGDRFRGYVAFEPDTANFDRLAQAAGGDSRIEVVKAGLGRGPSQARFVSTHAADARIAGPNDDSSESVSIVALDDHFADRDVPTFIKLDIEGSEAEAVQGASGLITVGRPTMAISAYHYPTDLWTIPLLLARLAPTSRIVLRHYTREVDDTVCYAIAAADGDS